MRKLMPNGEKIQRKVMPSCKKNRKNSRIKRIEEQKEQQNRKKKLMHCWENNRKDKVISRCKKNIKIKNDAYSAKE